MPRWRLPRGRPDPDPGASMALLREVRDRPLDPGYATAARTRQERGLPASTGSHSLLLIVSAVLLGFLLTVAAQTLRSPDPAAAGARQELVQRIEEQQHLGDQMVQDIAVLRGEVDQLQDAASQDSTGDLTEELRVAGLRAGASPLVGPGVVITMDDAAPSDDLAPAGSDERVLARDLQVVVNGLWSRGAEAVSINDQRLTSTASIRFAGEAIVVDFRGLARPYVVSAIGDPEVLLQEMSNGATGRYVQELRDDYRLSVEVVSAEEVTVPAATRLTTRVSTVPDLEEDHR